MLQFTNTSEDTIYSLPFQTPTSVSLRYGMLPASSGEWWTPQQAAAAATLPAPAPAAGGIVDWLKQNQTAVFITAGGLFVLAMFAGRRR